MVTNRAKYLMRHALVSQRWPPVVVIVDLKLLRRNQHLEAISSMQLLHQDGHVVLDGLFADLQIGGDLLVCGPAQKHGDNLPLARAELNGARRRLPQRSNLQLLYDLAGKGWRNEGLAVV